MSLKFSYLSGHSPVQSEGYFDNVAFYFRAVGQYWAIELTDECDMTTVLSLKVKYCDDSFSAGWMPHDEAFLLIVSMYFRWKNNVLHP